MVDLAITAASVLAGPGAKRETGTAGETITAGQPVYLDTSTNRYRLADSNAATEAARIPRGIALNGAATDQPLTIQTTGDIAIGATLVEGTAYYLSDTPGGIAPRADIGAGEYVCLIGLAKSTSVLGVNIQYSGVSL